MKSRILSFLSAALLIIVLVSCGSSATKVESFDTWDIHTELQASYLADDNYENIKAYANGRVELSRPVSPTFSWKANKDFKDPDASISLLFWEDPDDVTVYPIPAGESSFTVSDGGMNLRVNTTYHWQLTAQKPDGTEVETEVYTFTTEGGIRNICIDGVTNFRDLGGKTTMDGSTVKQGLLYRSGRFNEKFSKDLLITAQGLEQIEALGIVTDIDLRGDIDKKTGNYANGYPSDESEIMVSPLGENIKYVLIPRVWNNLLMTGEEGASMIREIFDILCDEASYPIVFHCSIGTDRTGVAAYLIGCALGLSDEVLLRDYLFSNFGNIGGDRLLDEFDLGITGIRACEGETYQEKGLNYLYSIGITEAQIGKLKSILLED
jgi:hypothetical protein